MPEAPDRPIIGRTPTPPGIEHEHLRVELPRVGDSVAEVRRLVRRFATGAVDPDRIDDLVLAASELATNAVEHAGASTFHVSLRRQPPVVLFAVHSAANDGFDVSRLLRPDALDDPTALRGRGLGIVRALADAVEIGTDGGELTVWCRFRCR